MSENEKPFHNPFAALRGLAGARAGDRRRRGDVHTGRGRSGTTRQIRAGSAETSKPIPRAVVRLERSGRGGKEVTVVEHLGIAASARDEWLKALKAALGCGGTVEDERLVLQGDQRKRLPALLQARGVKKVTLG